MAGYQTMADALIALLQAKTPASTSVKTTNSSANSDYRVMEAPENGISVVAVPGPFTRERLEFGGGKGTDWTIDLQVLAQYLDDETTHDLLMGRSQDIIDTVDAWPKLNGTSGVYLAEVTGGLEPVPLYAINGEGPHWMMRQVRVSVQEDITVAENE